MSEDKLRAMIDYASGFAERWFREHGELHGLYHVVTEAGEQIVMQKPFPENKDLSAAVMRRVFEDRRVVRYCYMDECWALEAKPGEVDAAEMERLAREGIADDPRRAEMLMFTAEDRGRQLMAHRRITRPADGRPRLGPLVVHDGGTSKGRMVGMLRPAGRPQ